MQWSSFRVLSKKAPYNAFLSYPIDQERTTFGRDSKCDVRMYFAQVDELSCTLTFEDYKVGDICRLWTNYCSLLSTNRPSSWLLALMALPWMAVKCCRHDRRPPTPPCPSPMNPLSSSTIRLSCFSTHQNISVQCSSRHQCISPENPSVCR